MSRPTVQLGVLAVLVGLAAVIGVGGFGTATVDRGGAADIADSDDATLGVEARDRTVTVNETFPLLNLTNHFEANVTDVTADIKTDSSVNITDTPASIDVDSTKSVMAKCTKSNDGESITITTTAEARSTAVQVEPTVEITCKESENGQNDGPVPVDTPNGTSVPQSRTEEVA